MILELNHSTLSHSCPNHSPSLPHLIGSCQKKYSLYASQVIFPYLSLPFVHFHCWNCFSCICYLGAAAVATCYYSFLAMLIRQRFQQKSKQRNVDVEIKSYWRCTLQFWATVQFHVLIFFSQMAKQILPLQLLWSDGRTMFSCLKHNSTCQVLVSPHLDSKILVFKAAIVH